MSYKKAVLLFAFAFIMQLSIINLININGIVPDLTLCLVIMITFLFEDGFRYGAIGIISALLLDLCTGQYVGISSLGMIIVMAGIVLLCRSMNRENKLSFVIVTAAGTLIYGLLLWLFMAMLGDPTGILYVLMYQPFYMAYNIVFSFILYLLMIKKAVRHRNDRYFV
ncbi:MAG TPA: hypothetical protein PLM92_00225 [Bacillota bacterium]|nr:hypothetical protein [Bacillota bacterium]HUM55740.1 hypothetical protein [Bacillota bacterium]